MKGNREKGFIWKAPLWASEGKGHTVTSVFKEFICVLRDYHFFLFGFVLLCFLIFKTEFLSVALAVLELAL